MSKENQKEKEQQGFSIKKTLINLFLDKNIRENLNDLERVNAENAADIKDILSKHMFSYIFPILKKDTPQIEEDPTCNKHSCILGEDVLNDLEILKDYQNTNPKNTLIYTLSTCSSWAYANHNTQGAFFFLSHILAHPIYDIQVLSERQLMIKNLHLQSNLCKKDDAYTFSWKMVKKNEKKMAWFLNQDKDDARNLNDLVYLNYWLLDRINRSASFLTGYNLYRIILSPIIGIFTPICYVLIPFLVIKWKYKIPISFKTYLQMTLSMLMTTSIGLPKYLDRLQKISVGFTIIFYFQGLFNSIELSQAIYKLTKMFVTKMNGFINFVHHSHNIIQSLGKPYMHCYKRFGFLEKDIKEVDDPTFSNLDVFHDCFDSNQEFNKRALGGEDGEDFSLFRNFGRQLSHFKYLDVQKYIPLIQKIYFIDCLLSIGMLTHQPSNSLNFNNIAKTMCWVTFKKMEEQTPYFSIQECYHPSLIGLPFEKVVKNNVCMSKAINKNQETDKRDEKNESARNIILTGPNAGGKSTFIKSIMISILLAQTLTVSNSASLELTPFTYINTQINIPDCKGKQSLFEAEMLRSKKNFDIIEKLRPDQFSVIAMDEIFSSTNPIEGMAGAYAIARKLGEKQNVMNIISTHYAFLTKLEKKENEMYKNYKMNVNLDENNMVVSYPYKIYPGVSKQYIALELLRKNGFDASIIDEAVSIKNSFIEMKQQTKQNKKEMRLKGNENKPCIL